MTRIADKQGLGLSAELRVRSGTIAVLIVPSSPPGCNFIPPLTTSLPSRERPLSSLDNDREIRSVVDYGIGTVGTCL